MTPEAKARIVGAIALSTLFLSGTPARSAPAVAAVSPAETRLPHIAITGTGRGSPVVLIPGLSTPRAVWAGITPELARTHRVITVQINGFAGDAPGANLQAGLLDGVVADLHGWLVANKLSGVPVIGHSLGGLTALMLAHAHPADTGRLLIVDALPFIGAIFAPGATVAMLEPQARAMRDAMAASYGKPADPATLAAIAARNALKPESRAQVSAWAAKADARVSAQALYEDMTTDLRPALTGIATPITVLVPYSTALPRERAQALYRDAYAPAPHAEIVPVADSGHFVMLDQPTAFAAAVSRFLR